MARPGLSPRVINFDQTWASLSDGISKIITMSGVKGMPLVEYVAFLLKYEDTCVYEILGTCTGYVQLILSLSLRNCITS